MLGRVGVTLPTREPAQALRFARAAESRGFDTVWAGEVANSAFIGLAAVATGTERIGLATGIVLAFTRSPLITAYSALDLDNLSGGRFVLGLGTGARRLNENWHGVAYGTPVPHLRECIECIRLIVEMAPSGRPIRYSGEYYTLDLSGYQPPRPAVNGRIPIYVAGVGPKMCQMAGRVADGLLGITITSPRWLAKVARPNVEAGLRRAGRERDTFDLCGTLCAAVSTDRRLARRAAAAQVAFYATVRTYAPLFALHGFEREAAAVREAFDRRDVPAMIERVTEEMVDAFTVAGTADEVRRAFAERRDLADSWRLNSPSPFIDRDEAHALHEALLDLFAEG